MIDAVTYLHLEIIEATNSDQGPTYAIIVLASMVLALFIEQSLVASKNVTVYRWESEHTTAHLRVATGDFRSNFHKSYHFSEHEILI